MATVEEVEEVRRFTDEPTTDTYTDLVLSGYVDDEGSVDGAASRVWQEKAAKYSKLVNVSESGSSRSMQQIFQNAQEMAKFYSSRAEVVISDSSIPFTVPSERP